MTNKVSASKKKAAKKPTQTVQFITTDGTQHSMSVVELGCMVYAAIACASGVVQTMDDMPEAAAGITQKGMKNLGKAFIQTFEPIDGTQPQ